VRIGDADTRDRVLVIAETGNNHEGDPAVARELVKAAAGAGAHAVKLQVFETTRYVRRRDEARFRQLSSFQLPRAELERLTALAHELGLLVIATPFDLGSAEFLEPLVDAYKIASGDNDFWPLIDAVVAAGKPVIGSTGMLDLDGTTALADRLRGAPDRALLHCVSAYPARPEHLNLKAIPLLEERLGCTIGYSDHALGLDAAVTAAGVGARIVEKHLTLRRDFSDFRDHQLSAEPDELRELVERLADPTPPDEGDAAVRTMLGRAEKVVTPDEEPNAVAARRSIAAARDLPRGHAIRAEDLIWVRPRDGLAPGEEHLLVGRSLARDVPEGDSILAADVL
jgi:N,N'-diacetyllegionaminate synthase